MKRCLLVMALLLLAAPGARSAELAGVTMQDTQTIDGARMVLNGLGLRTYSLLSIRIYVAGLYLPRRTGDPAAILNSAGLRVLELRFLRDVTATQARNAWRESLRNSCQPPSCALPAATLREYLATVQGAHRGDLVQLAFLGPSLIVRLNGQILGQSNDPVLSHAVLASFIGAHSASPAVRSGLLGQP